MGERICQECSAIIPPQQGSARPRKFCVVCRPPKNRPNPRVITLPKSSDTLPDIDLPVVASYRRQLDAADRLETPEGTHVMLLVELFANGKHTAAGAASLSKELRSAMELALRGAAKQADALDELSARRTRKATGA